MAIGQHAITWQNNFIIHPSNAMDLQCGHAHTDHLFCTSRWVRVGRLPLRSQSQTQWPLFRTVLHVIHLESFRNPHSAGHFMNQSRPSTSIKGTRAVLYLGLEPASIWLQAQLHCHALACCCSAGKPWPCAVTYPRPIAYGPDFSGVQLFLFTRLRLWAVWPSRHIKTLTFDGMLGDSWASSSQYTHFQLLHKSPFLWTSMNTGWSLINRVH